MSSAWRGVLSAAVLLAPACKSNVINQTNTTNVFQSVIGQQGGRIDHPDGARLVFPAGALTTDTTIKISSYVAGDLALAGLVPPIPSTLANVTIANKVFAFEPHGQTFGADVVAVVPIAAPNAQAVLYRAEPGGAWAAMPDAVVGASYAQVSLRRFSFFFLGAPARATDGGTTEDPTPTDAGRPVPPSPPDAGEGGCAGPVDCPSGFDCVEVPGAPGGRACEPACPEAPLQPQAPPGDVRVTGSLQGFSSVPTADMAISATLTEDGPPNARWVRTMTLTATPWTSACEHQARAVTVLTPGGGDALVLRLRERSATRPASAYFPPGTYTLEGPVEVSVGGSEATSCGGLSGFGVPLQPGSSITLSEVNEASEGGPVTVSGTFDLRGVEGEGLTGEFRASVCNAEVQRRANCCVSSAR
jgi:hypothetical protein